MTTDAGDRNFDHEFLTLHEFVDAARDRLDDNGWDYLVGGTETETTLKRNRAALDAVALRPRVLVDVSELDATTSFLGRDVRLPVMLAPVGGLETFDPEGAVAVARAARDGGVAIMSSSVSPCPKPDVRAAAGDSPAVFQLYVRGFGRFIEDEVEAAIEAGFDAFAFTVDTAVYSRRERDIVKRFDKPWRAFVNAESVRAQAALSWKDIERIRKAYDIPLMLKGIGTAEDAKMAVDHGINAVYVSNHGGRQLDHGLGSAAVLHQVAQAVGRHLHALTAKSLQVGKARMRADTYVPLGGLAHGGCHHVPVTRMHAAGDIGRSHDFQQAGIIPHGPGPKALAHIGVQVDCLAHGASLSRSSPAVTPLTS